MIWSNSDRYYNNNYFQKDVSLHQKQQQNIKNILVIQDQNNVISITNE